MVNLTVSSLSDFPVNLFDEGIAISLRPGSAPRASSRSQRKLPVRIFGTVAGPQRPGGTCGGPGRIRTCNRPVMSRALYP